MISPNTKHTISGRNTKYLPYIANSDIRVYKELKLSVEKELPHRRTVVTLLFYLFCVCAFCFTFFTLYSSPYLKVHLGWLAALTILGYLFFFSQLSRKHEKSILIGLGAIMVSAGLILYKNGTLPYGSLAIANIVIDMANFQTRRFLIPFRLHAKYMTSAYIQPTILFLLALSIFLLAYSVLCRPNIYIYIAITLLPLAVGLYYGLIPDYVAFICLLISYILVAFLHIHTRRSTTGKSFTTRTDKSVRIIKSQLTDCTIKYSFGLRSSGLLLLFCVVACVLSTAVFSPPVYNSNAVKTVREAVFESIVPKPYPKRTCSLYNGQVGMTTSLPTWFFVAPQDLLIQSPNLGQTMYLKGYIGANYRGDRWERIDQDRTLSAIQPFTALFKEAGSQPQNLNSDYARLNQKIKNPALDSAYLYKTHIVLRDVWDMATKRFTYVPYNAIYPQFTDDTRTTTKKGEKRDKVKTQVPCEFDLDATIFTNPDQWAGGYTFYAYATESLLDIDMDYYLQASKEDPDVAIFVQREAAYRQFVKQYYTQLPKDRFREIRKTYTPQALEESGSLSNFIGRIRNDLAGTCTYSEKNDRLPQGQDFVEYFLYKSKQGHSSHFASAAAIMLRAAGIPTRYVEGYYIDPSIHISDQDADMENGQIQNLSNRNIYYSPNYTYTLNHTNIHAWVEIYLDGYGWIPVEFTPGFVQNTDLKPIITETLANSEVENDLDFSVSSSGQKNINNTSTITNTSRAHKQFSSFISRINNLSRPTVNAYLLFIVCVFMIIAVLYILLRRYILLQKRKRSFYTNSPRRNTINIYQYLVEVLTFWDIAPHPTDSYRAVSEQIHHRLKDICSEDVFSPILQTALLAGFGNEPMTEQQVYTLVKEIDSLIRKLYRHLSIRKKIALRWRRALW